MRKKDVAVSIGLVALAVGFWVPARALSQDRASRMKCGNNLKQIALGAMQYSDDKRFYPHLGPITKLDNDGKTLPAGNDVPPRCLRALAFFNYLDNPECFVCPESDDQPIPLSDRAKTDIRHFGWGGADLDVDGPGPIVNARDGDRDADKLKDLSYSWTLQGYTSNSMSQSKLSGDRARRAGAGAKQPITGNHGDGYNVVHVDAHTSFLKSGSDEVSLLASTAPNGFKLVCYDESGAGGPSAGKAYPEPDPAAKAKARKLLESGGFEVGLKSDIAVALASFRARADNADAYSKWAAGLKTDEVLDKVAAAFARFMDAATLDAAVAFYESAAGKQIAQSQAMLAKARKLAALTEPERLARGAMTSAGGRASSPDQPGARELAIFEFIGLTAAVYVKTLSLENMDGAIAFYESSAGAKYATGLQKATVDVQDLLRAWLDAKVHEPGSPFVAAARDGNEAAAIGALKTLSTSEAIFREGDKDRNGVLDYGSLEALGKASLIDSVLASGKKQGYLFECKPGTDAVEFLWWATASPEKPGETGTRYFYTNQTGVIWYSDKPFKVDTKTCKEPEGAKPLGR